MTESAQAEVAEEPPNLDAGPCAPQWLELVVLVAGCGVMSFGGLGLLLADTGHFSAGLAIGLGAIATAATAALAWPRRARAGSTAPRTAMGASIAAGAVAVVLGGWNAIYAGHHVYVDNDPGVYAVTGRWLAGHHSLIVPADAAWRSSGLHLNFASAGMYPTANHTLQFQFVHLVPTLLAQAYAVGGNTLMFRLNPLLVAVGLLGIYVVGCRLVRRPWLVVAAIAALGVSLPELLVARDTFSEPASQVLLWTAIWLLIRCYRERHLGLGLVAGLMAGATVMTHVDAVAYLIPIPILGAVAWLNSGSAAERWRLLRLFGAVTAGIVPPAVLGTFDVQRRAGHYYDDLRSHVVLLYAATAAALVIAGVAAVLWPAVRERVWPRIVARRNRLGYAAGGVVGAGLLWLWALRPDGPVARGRATDLVKVLQSLEGLPAQPNRTFAEQSMRWMEWYIGPVTLALGVAGLALMAMHVIRRGSPAAVVVIAMTAPLTAAYLWSPSIAPDQVFAMRRFVPASLPLFVLAAAYAVDVAIPLIISWARHPKAARWAIGTTALTMIAFPLGATLPLWRFETGANYLPLVSQVCTHITPRAAVLFPPADPDATALMQTIRSWCDVPAGQLLQGMTPSQEAGVVAGLRAGGRTVWLLGSSPANLMAVAPATAPQLIGQAVSAREIGPTLSRPPTVYGTSTLVVYAAALT